MNEEETTTPAPQPAQHETVAQTETNVQPQTETVAAPAGPGISNWLQGAFILIALVVINFVVYRSLKHSAQTGDNGNASSADGIANLLNSTKQNPSYDAFLGLGVAYYNDHRWQDAIDAWQKGLQYKPQSDILYSNIGAAYNCLSKWNEGKANCEKALSINPSFALARNNLNWAVGELAKAGTPAKPNTGLDPGAAPAPATTATFNSLLDQGLGYYNQKNFTEAINSWKKALQINPNSEVVYSNIGAAYGCLHMWREQVAACQKALAINPNYQLAANNLAWGKSELAKRGMKP